MSSDEPPGALCADDLVPGEIRVVPDGRGSDDRIVWCTASGVVAAGARRCPHSWSDLAVDGVVDGEELVCLAHHWRFDPDGVGTKLNVKGRRDRKGDLAVVPVVRRQGWVVEGPGTG